MNPENRHIVIKVHDMREYNHDGETHCFVQYTNTERADTLLPIYVHTHTICCIKWILYHFLP